ncbi:MAG: S8 family peptidase [Candidatus Aminicenantes bacterium]|nr:S8 family peptidase [Candidatus Aminicenantes bacterium]
MKLPAKGSIKAIPALLALLVVGLGTTDAGLVRQTKLGDRLFQRPFRTQRVERPALRRGPRYAADRVLVRFKPDVVDAYAEGLLRSYGFSSIRLIPRIGVYSVWTSPGVSVAETLAMLRRNGDIEQARPDYRARPADTPNDPFFSRYQYNLRNRGGVLDIGDIQLQTTAGDDIKATPAWDAARGDPEVVIAILDSGVDRTHPDLAAKVISPGWDFANDDEDATDDNWHGTHVAGVAAADTNNAQGIAGVAWDCKILPVKVAGADGMGFYSWIIDGIIWATDQGAEVINLSMGGDFDDPFLEDACKYAFDRGVVVVASAGNDFGGPVLYPAAYDSYVLAVAATDYSDQPADFSNSGPQVDVAAPGVYILGPAPQWYVGEGYLPYVFASGTSQAAPHVSGLAALIKSLKPELTPADVMKIIRYTADDVNASVDRGRDDHIGYGRINMERALVPYILK